VAGVGQGVGGVGVDLEQEVVAEALADRGHRLGVPAGLDLELDAEIALVEVAGHGVQQLGDRVVDADRHPGRDPVAGRAQPAGQRLVPGPQPGVEHGQLQGRLGHAVALDEGHGLPRSLRVEVPGRGDGRDQEAAQDVGGAVGVLRGVAGLGRGHTLPPPLGPVGDGPDQEHVPVPLNSERGPERRHQRQRDPPQLDPFELHLDPAGCSTT
jgi:hypothetical protein